MREGQFIKQNLKRWEEYQQPTEDPDEVAKRFTYLVDDLSYAKTFYPQGNTVKYINSIAANIYLSIYKNKKEKAKGSLLSGLPNYPWSSRSTTKPCYLPFFFSCHLYLLGCSQPQMTSHLPAPYWVIIM